MVYKSFISFLIAILLGTEGIFTGYYFAGMSVVRILELVVFILIFQYFIKDIKKNKLLKFYMKFISILILLLFLKLGVFVFMKDEMATFIFVEIIRTVFYGIIAYLGYFMLKNNFKYINIYLLVSFLVFLVAFFQIPITPFTDLAFNIKTQYFSQNNIMNLYENSFHERISGIYAFVLILDYALLAASFVTVYMYIKTSSKIYLYFFLFVGVIIFFTLTRSTIISWVVIFLYVIWKIVKMNNLFSKVLITFILLVFVVYLNNIYTQNMDMLSRATSFTDETTSGRIPLLLTGVYALLLHPFGISDKEYTDVKIEMYQVFHHPDILMFPSHNALINLGMTYTILGLIAFIIFIYYILKKYLKHIDIKYHGFFKISMLSYLLNGIVHNSFIFNLDFTILIFLSLLFYEYYLENINNQKNIKGG